MTMVPAVRTAVTFAALLVMGAGTLRAQRTIDTTIAVRANARLALSVQTGNITVRSWSRSQIRIMAESDDRTPRIEVSETPAGVRVTTSHRGGHEADFTISVPSGTAIEIQALSSDVEINNVCGALDINNTNGDVAVNCTEGDVRVQTISGDIMLANARGPVDLSTTSGDIDVRALRGPVTLQAVSGDITIEAVESNEITAETVSGDVEYSGRLADSGRYKFASHNGDVTVHLGGTPNATIAVETFNGEFESEFQIQLREGSRIGKNWEFRLGTGSARVQLSSFSGTIALRRSGAGGGNREE